MVSNNGIRNSAVNNNTSNNANINMHLYINLVLCVFIFLFQYLYTRETLVLLFLGLFLIGYILSGFGCTKAKYILCLIASIYFFWYLEFYNILILYSSLLFFLNRKKKSERYDYLILIFSLIVFMFCISNASQMVYRLIEALYVFVCLEIVSFIQFLISNIDQRNKNMQEVLKNAALNQLREENLRKELAVTNQLIEKNTRLEERERISRDIHNVAGHTITAGLMALEAAQAVYEKNDSINTLVYEKMEVAHQRVKEGLDEIRKAVRLLNQEDSIALSDCLDSIRILLERFELDTEVRIRHNLNDIEQNTVIDMKLVVFFRGSITELITNGVKHGGAGRFVVICRNDKNNISWTVIDNGIVKTKKTFQEYVGEGFGLKKIYETVRQYGGGLTIDDEEGFTVKFFLPLANIEK